MRVRSIGEPGSESWHQCKAAIKHMELEERFIVGWEKPEWLGADVERVREHEREHVFQEQFLLNLCWEVGREVGAANPIKVGVELTPGVGPSGYLASSNGGRARA